MQAEGLARADPGARNRIGANGIFITSFHGPHVFGSGVSREPYKSLGALVANFVVNSVANFEACDWSMWFMQVLLHSSHWLTILRPGWRQVAVQYCTNS
jgi:hypothetical protein